MASAFTTQERASITEALLRAARRCACTTGLKKTTLDMLTHQSGISKSAFYAFFPSKEHLFLQVHAQWHREIFHQALDALAQSRALSPRDRAAHMLETTLRSLWQSEMFLHAAQDWPLLERKLPRDEIDAFFRDDLQMARELIHRSHVSLLISLEEAAEIVQLLFVSLQFYAGSHFPPALTQLIHAACAQCIAA